MPVVSQYVTVYRVDVSYLQSPVPTVETTLTCSSVTVIIITWFLLIGLSFILQQIKKNPSFFFFILTPASRPVTVVMAGCSCFLKASSLCGCCFNPVGRAWEEAFFFFFFSFFFFDSAALFHPFSFFYLFPLPFFSVSTTDHRSGLCRDPPDTDQESQSGGQWVLLGRVLRSTPSTGERRLVSICVCVDYWSQWIPMTFIVMFFLSYELLYTQPSPEI